MAFTLQNKVRIVTAAALFDGHDAAINIMRRIMQSKGAEIIHLGHNRSVHEIVECAIEEDVQGIAITSYQGGLSFLAARNYVDYRIINLSAGTWRDIGSLIRKSR